MKIDINKWIESVIASRRKPGEYLDLMAEDAIQPRDAKSDMRLELLASTEPRLTGKRAIVNAMQLHKSIPEVNSFLKQLTLEDEAKPTTQQSSQQSSIKP